jgi:hypothetical protein
MSHEFLLGFISGGGFAASILMPFVVFFFQNRKKL